ncbi:unnamed protein product [Effrenium voratum]|nr:unnamed protein product [Effrenium voratum]
MSLTMWARRLVEEATGSGDLTEVYQAQILTAQREKRKVLRAPLLRHLERLDGLAEELRAHQPYLQAAKAAFDKPTVEADSGSQSASSPARSPGEKDKATASESPVVILQPKTQRFMGFRAPKEYMIKFLESAIDLVGAAASATGMSTDVPVSPSALAKLETAVGAVSPWLDAEAGDSRVRDPEPVDWSSAQTLWERCRRKSDRRWTLA